MSRLLRWYNKNRKTLWSIILTSVTVIALIQILNNYYNNNPKEENSSTISTTAYNTPNYSVITQKTIDETTSEKSINLIESFFDFCNEGEIEKAYNLLSKDCKKELYPTIDEFKLKYYNKIFTERKSYSSTLWITNSLKDTYRVQIMNDLLSTGEKDNMPIEGYYTIITENGSYKLNIGNYIGKEEINISKTQNNIKVNIVSKKIYMDYEIYEITVQNNTGNDLIFNTKENTKSMYIQDQNELKYIAFLNEIANTEFEVINGTTKTFEIKFNRGYKPTINIEKIIFEDIKVNKQIVNIEIEL